MNRPSITPLQRTLNIWAVVLIVWSLYRVNFPINDIFDELIAKPFVFIGIIAFYLKKIVKINISDEIKWHFSLNLADLGVILMIGLTFFFTAFAGNFAKGSELVSESKINYLLSTPGLIAILLSLATAISEEFLSVGFVLPKIYDETKNYVTSVLFSGGLFAVLHIPILVANLKLDGYTILALLFTNFILGSINALLFLDRKNLLIPILIHFIYNISILLIV